MAAKKPLMRSLGEFFGHIARGFKSDVGGGEAQRREVSRSVEEERIATPRGTVTVRRTVIEEVEVPRDPGKP